MKIPKQVKVGGVKYNVSMVEANNDFFGRHNGTLSTIEISKGLSKDQERATIVHESLHAIIMERGLQPIFKDAAAEEAFITCFEGGLYAWIKDNPKLMQYLMEK